MLTECLHDRDRNCWNNIIISDDVRNICVDLFKTTIDTKYNDD